MSILNLWNSRCIQSFKFLSISSVACKHSSPQFHVKSRILFLTPVRPFSFEGFYTSIALSTPVLTIQDLLLTFHSYSGLPWWAIISLSTLGIRCAFVLPIAVHTNQVISRITNINAELVKIGPELNKEVNIAASMYGWNENTATKIFRQSMKKHHQKFIIRDNCHPFKIILLAMFQVPVWICFSLSLRNIIKLSAENPVLSQQLKTEGMLWFADLTVPDPFFIPILLTLMNLILIEITTLKQIGKGSKYQKYLLHFMRAIILVVGCVATINPASVSFYWLCSSIFGATQNIMFLSPRIRRILRIPKTSNESVTPFKDITSNFRKRFYS